MSQKVVLCPIKLDPHLRVVRLMLRKLGDVNWLGANITNVTTQSSGTISGLIEGEIYEATLGTQDVNGNTYFYTTPVQVKVSGNPGLYTSGSVSGTL